MQEVLKSLKEPHCSSDANTDWEKLVQFVSEEKAPKSKRKPQ